MATYIILNLLFIAVAICVLTIAKALHISRRVMVVLVILLVCTTIFDSLIIIADIVHYDTAKILEIYIGAAPVEDFFYSLLAAIIVPSIWHSLTLRQNKIEKQVHHE